MPHIKTRFPPSPTGFLHIGSLRTALFNYLIAKKLDGSFVLRIEDTDRERFVEGGVENIIQTLDWAGIQVDEGPYLDEGKNIAQKGESGPYVQSQRLDIYKKHVQKLLEKGDAYYCFCSKERLSELRKKQEETKQPTGYDGHCRGMNKKDLEEKLNSGIPFVIRLAVPKEGKTTFTDAILGDISFDNSIIDDQVLMKADGFPTYHLAVVVDDHLMGITHISRGSEWLPSTPKHILLYIMFGWEIPVYAHQPLLVNEKKQKLSKRHGDVSVKDFKEKGYLIEALINFVAFLGWNPGDEREIFSLKELENVFSLEKMAKSPAVFNREKLEWYNKQYMMQIDLDEVTKRAIPFFINAGVVDKTQVDGLEEFEYLKKVVDLERTRANTLVELVDSVGFIFAKDLVYDASLLVWKKSTKEDAKEKLIGLKVLLGSISESGWELASIEQVVKEWITKNECGVGNTLWPLRVALSGQKNSPGPFDLVYVLGKEKVLKRISAAIDMM
ncbi:MAG: glutamate--tRNA ligase [Candidatus Magasanikbacteria bacterium]|nr:glutamate--tRNA ligase [Candidatus Magasanikbacteria bacterium]|tara:strand:- start:270 stop:1766 length:1497 start_codon:yes stop_codon:yes gene_type:complete